MTLKPKVSQFRPHFSAVLFGTALVIVVFGLPVSIHAQAYPTKPIRFVAPFPQGGLHASREQGSRLRDGTARESCAAAGIRTSEGSSAPYPTKPIRFIVPFPQGGLHASREQGSRLRDATVRESCAAAGTKATPDADQKYPTKPIRFIVPFPQGGLHASREQGSRLRDATVRESCAAAGTKATPDADQKYPTKPIRFIVPFPPGGGTDILARVVGQKLTESMGQQVIVDNRPGAGGNLGAELATKASPDGHTILMVSASYAVNAAVYKLTFDPLRDLAPVTQVATVPFVLVANPSLPANNFKELLALVQARPGQLNYASSGNGSSPHLAGELLTMMTNTKIVHIPYKGGGPALADVIGGQVQLMFNTVVQSLPQIKAGKLKAIAVGSLKRSSALPDVPTIAESGVPGYDVTNWFGVLVPGATAKQVVARLNKDIVQHLQSPDLKVRLAAEGADPVGSTPAEFERVIRSDIEKYTRIVKAAGVRIE